MTTFKVQSPNVRYTTDYIESKYTYETTKVDCSSKGSYIVRPVETQYTFRTERRVPKVGCMLVGWGGNNGSTITAAVLANKLGLSWDTKQGVKVCTAPFKGIKYNFFKYQFKLLRAKVFKKKNDKEGNESHLELMGGSSCEELTLVYF